MAIKYEITADSSGFVTEIRKIKETVGETTRAVKSSFDEQEKAAKHSFDEQGKGAESLRGKLRALTQELAEATVEFRAMSDAEKQSAKGQELLRKIDKLTQDAGTLRDAMDDANRSVRGVASDTKNWDALAGGINVATSAFGGLTGAASLFGAKEEELQDIQTKLQASLAISNALSVIQNNLQKESALMLGIRDIREKAAATAIAIRTAAEGKGVIATKAATAAQAAFNLVAKANPYVLLATAILTVVGALAALHIGSKRAKESQEALAKAEEEAAQRAKEAREAFVSASAEAMNTASRISAMQTAYMKANSEMEKTQILKEAAKQFKALGLECNSLADAQRLLVNQGGQVIEMLRLQGTVAALTALRMEAFKKSFAAIYENNGDAGYAASLAGYNSQVQDLDKQIAQYQGRIGAIQSKLPMARSGGGGSTMSTRTGSANTGKTTTEAERNAIRERQKREEAMAARELELSTAEATIKAKEEGNEKIIAQIWLDYNKEMLAIEKSQESLRQKRIDEAKKTWDADIKNKDKDFWASDIYKATSSAFTEAELKYRAEREDAALMERERRLQEAAEVEKEAMRNYLKQYGDYQQQRLAIEEEYQGKIDKARTEGEKLMLAKQRDEELRSVDERYGLVTQAMADLFADASKKSVKAIQDIISKYEALVKYMEGHKGTASENELAMFGLSQDDINKILNGEVSIKELTDRLKELKGELKDRSPYQSFIGNMRTIIDLFKQAKNSADLGNAISSMTAEINQFLPSLKEFGANIANIFGADDSKFQGIMDSLGGLTTAGNGIGQIMSGDIVGGVMTSVGGISKIVSAIDGLFGADYSAYNKLVEEYNGLIDVWDELIDKKREYINESYGVEAYKAGEEAERLLANEMDAWRRLGRERVNSGASTGSHSIGVRTRKKMTADDWASVQRALGTTDLGGRLEGLYDLSSEQLQKLKEEAPAFWAKMDGDMRKYLQNIIDGAEQLEDIQNAVNKQLTNTSFDAVYDSFKSSLSDMDKSAYEFSRDFEKYMFDAMLSTEIDAKFRDRIKKWYEDFAKANEDSNISSSEMATLKTQWEQLAREGVELREQLRAVTGYGSSAEGSATYSATQTFTQEQGDVLNGRLSQIQMGVRQEVVIGEQIVENLKSMASVASNTQATNTAVLEIRNMMINTNSYLETVARYSKATYTEVTEKLETITNKVREL